MANEEPKYIFVFVHGTFARGAQWTRSDSKIATTVRRAIPDNILITTFDWSGRNSHRARLSGGAELSQQLRLLRSSHPSASLYVISHSHGGNVVAYALRDAGIRHALGGVICLGTPYIIPNPRNLKPTLRLLKIGSIAISVLAILVFTLLVFLVATFVADEPKPSTILLGTLFILVGGIICLLAASLGVRMDRYLKNNVAPRLKAMRDEIVASLQVTFFDVPMLNVQTRRDEAAVYLRLIEWGANVPFRAWSPTAIAWIFGAVTVVFVSWWTYLVLISPDLRQEPLHAIGVLILGFIAYLLMVIVVLFVITMIAQMVCVLWAKVFRGHVLGFGEEGFAKNWLASISTSKQPPGAERNRNEIFNVMGGGLHHSLLYEDQAVLRSIARWLSSKAD